MTYSYNNEIYLYSIIMFFGQIQQNNVMQRKYRCLKNILGQGIMDTRQNKMRPMLNTQLIVT